MEPSYKKRNEIFSNEKQFYSNYNNPQQIQKAEKLGICSQFRTEVSFYNE